MTITDLVERSYANSRDKGFHDPEQNPDANSIPTKLALIHSEVSEALEEYRRPDQGADRYVDTGGPVLKPEGFASELADAVIRIGDLAGAEGIDLETAIAEKMAYNATRPRLHGKRL